MAPALTTGKLPTNNNYGVNINIADYAKFSEIYEGERGKPTWITYYPTLEKRKSISKMPAK
jgi:hypothetical protein